MAALQVLLFLAVTVESVFSQAYNGFINPVFLPRALRDGYRRVGRLYNPYSDPLTTRGLDIRYNDFQRYPTQYSDYRTLGLDRRDNNGYRVYPDDLRYRSDFGLGTSYDRGQLLNGGQLLNRGQLLDREQLLNEGQFLDRGQLLNGGQYLNRDQVFDRGQLLNTGPFLDRGQILERRQILNGGQIISSTATPDISVTVQPNGSS